MNEKEYINSSEKLLHTDIRILLGVVSVNGTRILWIGHG